MIAMLPNADRCPICDGRAYDTTCGHMMKLCYKCNGQGWIGRKPEMNMDKMLDVDPIGLIRDIARTDPITAIVTSLVQGIGEMISEKIEESENATLGVTKEETTTPELINATPELNNMTLEDKYDIPDLVDTTPRYKYDAQVVKKKPGPKPKVKAIEVDNGG